MSERIAVNIYSLPYYNKYASCDYVLCGIDFEINCNGDAYHFRSESSKNCIQKLLTEIEAYLSGLLKSNTELYYYMPSWDEEDDCVYPYSFKINASGTWSFRYKSCQSDTEFDFKCEISIDDVISMQEQMKKQFAKIDWDSLGKTPIYTIDFPNKKFKWCYSAKALCESLNDACIGKDIKTMYVSAMNYAAPLRVEKNCVNYYLGAELIIQMEDILLDLLIHASGLFQWRVFDKSEYVLTGPTLKFIENGDEEFCEIGNVYNTFTADYTRARIKQVRVIATGNWEWMAKGFDKSKLEDPIELSETILFYLSNHYTLALHGWHDDFAIELLPSSC